MNHQPYIQLINYKRWADSGLCAAVGRSLDQLSEVEASITLRVIDHFHTVDRIFQHHLRGLSHSFRAPRSEVIPAFQALAQGVQEVDEWYTSYVAGLAASEFEQPLDFVFTSGKPTRMRRGEVLLHICMHGTYHRGNVGIILQRNGLATYADAITDFLEAGGRQ